jgi:hypothetical protein
VDVHTLSQGANVFAVEIAMREMGSLWLLDALDSIDLLSETNPANVARATGTPRVRAGVVPRADDERASVADDPVEMASEAFEASPGKPTCHTAAPHFQSTRLVRRTANRKSPLSGGLLRLRGRDSNPDYLIQSQASYH